MDHRKRLFKMLVIIIYIGVMFMSKFKSLYFFYFFFFSLLCNLVHTTLIIVIYIAPDYIEADDDDYNDRDQLREIITLFQSLWDKHTHIHMHIELSGAIKRQSIAVFINEMMNNFFFSFF